MKSRLTKLFSSLLFILILVFLVGCEFTFSLGTTASKTNSSTTDKGNDKSEVVEPKELKYRFYTIEDGVEDLSFIEGYPWINTSIEGVMGKIKRPEAKDDFFAYVNHDYLKDYKLPEGKDKYGGPIFESEALADQRVNEIINDPTCPLSLIKNLLIEGDIEGVKADIEAAMELTDEEIIDIFKSKDMFLQFVGQLEILDEKDEYFITNAYDYTNDLLISYYYAEYDGQKDDYALCIDRLIKAMGLNINDSLNWVKTSLDALFEIYERSYSENGPSYKGKLENLDSVMDGFIDLKSALLDLGLNEDDNVEIDEFPSNFSRFLEEEIASNGYGLIKDMIVLSKIFYYRYFIGAENYLVLYADGLVNNTGFEDGLKANSSIDDFVLYLIKDRYNDVLNREYSIRYANNPTREIIAGVIQEVIAEYKIILEENDWLSTETKAKALEKLNTMTYTVYFEDAILSKPNFETDKTNIIDIDSEYFEYAFIYYVDMNANAMSPYVANACYMPTSNQFVITHAVVSSYIDNPDIKMEEIYGSIGEVIGHEISHGFDSMGSNYDKNGNRSNWWTEEDKQTFKTKYNKIIDLYDTSLFSFNGENLDGDLVDGEVTADLGGLKVAIRLVSKLENPDYQAFFESYASLYSFVYSHEKGYNDTHDNPHPLSYLRVNLTIAQFDLFQQVYNIKEGDGMYITPEDRIVVW